MNIRQSKLSMSAHVNVEGHDVFAELSMAEPEDLNIRSAPVKMNLRLHFQGDVREVDINISDTGDQYMVDCQGTVPADIVGSFAMVFDAIGPIARTVEDCAMVFDAMLRWAHAMLGASVQAAASVTEESAQTPTPPSAGVH